MSQQPPINTVVNTGSQAYQMPPELAELDDNALIRVSSSNGKTKITQVQSTNGRKLKEDKKQIGKMLGRMGVDDTARNHINEYLKKNTTPLTKASLQHVIELSRNADDVVVENHLRYLVRGADSKNQNLTSVANENRDFGFLPSETERPALATKVATKVREYFTDSDGVFHAAEALAALTEHQPSKTFKSQKHAFVEKVIGSVLEQTFESIKEGLASETPSDLKTLRNVASAWSQAGKTKQLEEQIRQDGILYLNGLVQTPYRRIRDSQRPDCNYRSGNHCDGEGVGDMYVKSADKLRHDLKNEEIDEAKATEINGMLRTLVALNPANLDNRTDSPKYKHYKGGYEIAQRMGIAALVSVVFDPSLRLDRATRKTLTEGLDFKAVYDAATDAHAKARFTHGVNNDDNARMMDLMSVTYPCWESVETSDQSINGTEVHVNPERFKQDQPSQPPLTQEEASLKKGDLQQDFNAAKQSYFQTWGQSADKSVEYLTDQLDTTRAKTVQAYQARRLLCLIHKLADPEKKEMYSLLLSNVTQCENGKAEGLRHMYEAKCLGRINWGSGIHEEHLRKHVGQLLWTERSNMLFNDATLDRISKVSDDKVVRGEPPETRINVNLAVGKPLGMLATNKPVKLPSHAVASSRVRYRNQKDLLESVLKEFNPQTITTAIQQDYQVPKHKAVYSKMASEVALSLGLDRSTFFTDSFAEMTPQGALAFAKYLGYLRSPEAAQHRQYFLQGAQSLSPFVADVPDRKVSFRAIPGDEAEKNQLAREIALEIRSYYTDSEGIFQQQDAINRLTELGQRRENQRNNQKTAFVNSIKDLLTQPQSEEANQRELQTFIEKQIKRPVQGNTIKMSEQVEDDKGQQRDIYRYEGIIFRGDDRTLNDVASSGGLLSQNKLSETTNRIEAMGIRSNGIGATGKSGVSCSKTIEGAWNYGGAGGSRQKMFVIDTAKLPKDEVAYDLSAIVNNNNFGRNDETGGEVNCTGIPAEAIIGCVEFSPSLKSYSPPIYTANSNYQG